LSNDGRRTGGVNARERFLATVRKRYGKKLIIEGGIDKRILALDFAAIRRESNRKSRLFFARAAIWRQPITASRRMFLSKTSNST
jgi:hypothetical protein